jgi:hypothetical protein
MDLITDLPKCASGVDAVVVFVDRLTKMIVCAPTTKTVTAPQLAQIFVSKVFCQFGMPSSIVSDRDVRFTSNFWQALWQMLGTKLKMSTAFHPQTDGQTERANRTVEEMLRPYVHPRQDDWDQHLDLVAFAYNNATQASTGQTPFFLNHGRHPATPFDRALPRESEVPAANQFLQNLADATSAAKDSLRAAQERQATYADRSRREHNFQVGDKVLLSTKNLRPPAGMSPKLQAKYAGPFDIVRQASPNAFELALPSTLTIHPVFHVSLLKPFVVPPFVDKDYTRPGPLVSGRTGEIYEVDAILAKRREGGKMMYLVSWTGWPPEENSWQPARNVAHLKEDMRNAPLLPSPAVPGRRRRGR